jgi:hypothetical protein
MLHPASVRNLDPFLGILLFSVSLGLLPSLSYSSKSLAACHVLLLTIEVDLHLRQEFLETLKQRKRRASAPVDEIVDEKQSHENPDEKRRGVFDGQAQLVEQFNEVEEEMQDVEAEV